MHYELEFNIKTISKQINPTPTVLLNQTSIDQKNIPHFTQITITDVNSNNYQLRQNTIRDLRVMIGKIYAPRIQESELIIVLNNEIIQYDQRKYLVAHYYTCFEKIGHNKFKLKNDCQKKDQEIWKVDVDETITDESTGKSYSITGVLGLKPSQSSNDTGIRIYRKKRGILGCNSSAITDYNPFKLQEGKPAFLYMIGDIFLNDAFQKPLMGNDLPENNYLQELLDKVRQKHMRLFRQADEFRIAMLQPVIFDSIIHTTQKPSNESTYNFPQNESQRTADTIDKPKLESTVSKNNSPEKITYINPDSGLKFIFEESHNLTLLITLNEESNVLSVKCDQTNFKSHRTIGRLLNELILAMGVDEFRNKINYLNSFN
jgi:hypothetical protein